MLAILLTALAQSTSDLGDEVASDSGAVAVVGFIIAGFGAVLFAYIYRRRNG
ncbi:MAG: hypothetical protein AAF081_07650 [Actinomycetota bacterium]